MKSILFIPPDTLNPGVGRCFWLAHGLSRYFKVYYVQWEDSRSYSWLDSTVGMSIPKNKILLSAKCFFQSLITKIRISKQRAFGAPNLYYTFLPLMQKGALRHFIGEINARKVSRVFNKWSFQRFLKKKPVDYIFHGENMMLSEVLSDKIPAFYDMQDDFDESKNPSNLMAYEKEFQREFAKKCSKRFAINQATASHMEEFCNCSFEVIPNGAFYGLFSRRNLEKAMGIRKKLGLKEKFLISYIGADAWFDTEFVERLSERALAIDDKIHFLLVGNLPSMKKLPNISQIGFISPRDIHLYYLLSDAGFLPKEADSIFLKNSHPLKLIQYSAAKKPVVLPPMSDEEIFKKSNLIQVKFDVESWVDQLVKLRAFQWDDKLTRDWQGFSWEYLTEQLAGVILKS
jgi:hypothetical protein